MNTANIAILGYGVEGKSTERFFQNQGISCTIFDNTPQYDHILPLKKETSLDTFSHIFRSPGISPETEIGGKKLKEYDTLTSQTEYFFKNFPLSQCISVTGTKGKGTTSTLIFTILQTAGVSTFLGGNIGTPLLDILGKAQKTDTIVIEISSFQSQTLKNSPHIGIILMTTEDHLDYHKDKQEYWDAKAELIKHQTSSDFWVFHQDYERSRYISQKSIGKRIPFSPFSSSPCRIADNFVWYKNEKILPVSEITLLGKHNFHNIVGALEAVSLLDIPKEAVISALKNFSGLPMRLQKIGEKNGILGINDSFSTHPDTTIAGLESFPETNIAVLLGGSEKYSDYTNLYQTLVKSPLVFPVFLGVSGKRMMQEYETLFPHAQKHYEYDFFIACDFGYSFLQKKGNGVLLMSPASASFDQFTQYKERGEKFTEWFLHSSPMENKYFHQE
jgi:UDP-N-acetylmuramoylalanine--D-glutamate ligase